MENDMQLDDDAVGVEPTDVNIEDMTGKCGVMQLVPVSIFILLSKYFSYVISHEC